MTYARRFFDDSKLNKKATNQQFKLFQTISGGSFDRNITQFITLQRQFINERKISKHGKLGAILI